MQKVAKATARENNVSKTIDLSKRAVKLLEPRKCPRPSHKRVVKESAGQRHLEFDLTQITSGHIKYFNARA